MLLRFLRGTYDAKFGFIMPGDRRDFDIDDETLERWKRIKLVEVVAVEVEVEEEVAVEVIEGNAYENLTNAELYDICTEKGLEPKQKQSKAYYLDLLA